MHFVGMSRNTDLLFVYLGLPIFKWRYVTIILYVDSITVSVAF